MLQMRQYNINIAKRYGRRIICKYAILYISKNQFLFFIIANTTNFGVRMDSDINGQCGNLHKELVGCPTAAIDRNLPTGEALFRRRRSASGA
jgi:hypothetical protein